MENQPYSSFLDIKITRADPDGAEGYLAFRPELSDMLGHMTGGAYNSLADAVAGSAARAAGAMYVTQNCSLQYYVSTEECDKALFARAFVRHRGSRTCIIAVELYHEDGVIAADGQFSYSKI